MPEGGEDLIGTVGGSAFDEGDGAVFGAEESDGADHGAEEAREDGNGLVEIEGEEIVDSCVVFRHLS